MHSRGSKHILKRRRTARLPTISSAKQLVDDTIKSNRVVVFSATYCPYARKAKRHLKRHLRDDQMLVIELDQRTDGRDIKQYLGQITGATTVPRVFIDSEFVGGGDDVEELDESGQLEVLLREKGIKS